MMSNVIHDCNDEQCLVILKNIRRAIAKNGRLLVVESVIPSGDGPHYGKLVDVHMLVATGGFERTEAEHRALYEAAGFRWKGVHPTPSRASSRASLTDGRGAAPFATWLEAGSTRGTRAIEPESTIGRHRSGGRKTLCLPRTTTPPENTTHERAEDDSMSIETSEKSE